MKREKREKLYRAAIDHWGWDPQLNMIVQECAELIKAVMKFQRHKKGEYLSAIGDEVVDVEIMLEQFKIMHSSAPYDFVKDGKLERLQLMLEKEGVEIESEHKK